MLSSCWACCPCGYSDSDPDDTAALVDNSSDISDDMQPPSLSRRRTFSESLKRSVSRISFAAAQSPGRVWDRLRGVRGLVRLGREASDEMQHLDDPMPQCLVPYNKRLELLPQLPYGLRQREWRMLYSTAEDGCSLRTAYLRLQDQGPVLLLVKDRNQRVCGAFVSGASWEAHDNNFQGTGESFLFSWWPDGFRAHHWTRANTHVLLASHECLALGGGAHFGLWLGRSLASGSTGASSTFGNQPLAEHDHRGGLTPESVAAGGAAAAFEVLEVQAWGFEGMEGR